MKLGDMMIYTLTHSDADRIENRRNDWRRNGLGRMQPLGYQAHEGNPVSAGDEFPMLVTRVWDNNPDHVMVNGQVFLDGCDVLWITSVAKGEGQGTCREA